MNQDMPVPCLTTALTGPLQCLEQHLLANPAQIEAWFRVEWQKTPPPIYGSVDLRNAGFKLAPIDMNLFPAGFNNLNPDFISLCIQAVQNTIERRQCNVKRILLIPENHTRNLFYLEHLYVLKEIIEKAGFEVRIGSLLSEKKTIELSNHRQIHLEPITREQNRIKINDFDPCLIWLNNDLSSGIPEILQNIEQCIRPPVTLGWSTRLKSNHFKFYQTVVKKFSTLIDIDPWFIDPLFRYCPGVDFLKREGINCLVENASFLFDAIEAKYDEYQIKEKPFVVVKADAGTYGMSVMTIRDPNDLMRLNRKQRTKMSAMKGGVKVERVILQEGVHTFETINDATAEPVVYMIGRQVVGGFYRVHHEKGQSDNLNAPGMHFERLAFSKSCTSPDNCEQPDACVNRFYAYGVVARLSLLAAAREQQEENPC